MLSKNEMPPDGTESAKELRDLLENVSGPGFEDFSLMCETDQRALLKRAHALLVKTTAHATG